ncbi:helix-turn-helix domain-containing protein [Priestia aryabhattai]|uniref:helix-turn-helix domain-containing protein n=1 Tax=Priestia aryabhattai TaxID=412384 RepID=UPI0039A27F1C
MSNRVGEKLKELRIKRGYSYRKLAEKINIAPSYLSQIEKGQRRPSDDTLYHIADFFNVDISYFYIKEDDLTDFNETEKNFLFQKELSLENIADNYNLKIGDRIATKEEIEEAIKYIEALRVIAENKKHSNH